MNLLVIDIEGLVFSLHSFFCDARVGVYEEGLGNFCDAKEKILADGLLALAVLNHLHLSCNADFKGTVHGEFKIHATLLSSVHYHEFDTTAHKVVIKQNEGLRIV